MSGTPFSIVFRFILPIFIMAGQWYLLKRTRRFLKTTPLLPQWLNPLATFSFILFNALFLVLIFSQLSPAGAPRLFLYVIVYPTYVWEGATFFIFMVLAVARLIRFPFDGLIRIGKKISPVKRKITTVKSNPNFERFDNSRRMFLKTGAVAISAYSFIGATKGIIERGRYDVIDKTVRIRNLPQEFNGFTIGLMSDIHSSIFMTKEEMVDYAAALNNVKADVIFVPGDFVNSRTEEVYPCAEAFSVLRAPYGVYGCLGNHDYYADVEEVAKQIDACGIKLLRNDAVKIQKGSSFINLVGVDDIPIGATPEAYLRNALSSVHNINPKILLCHKPYYLDSFDAHNIDLTLAGHTHGGQIVFAKIGRALITPASLVSKYVWGLYKLNKAQMYVTRGIGTVGVPFRINCPPEITKITLQSYA